MVSNYRAGSIHCANYLFFQLMHTNYFSVMATYAAMTLKTSIATYLLELQFHFDPARKLSVNLYDICHCCVYSEQFPDDGQRNCPKLV